MNRADLTDRIAALMRPGHPVRRADVERADLPGPWAREISRASSASPDGTSARLAASDLAEQFSAVGNKGRAALALREKIRGSDRRAPKNEDPTVRRERITRRLEGIDGDPIESFDPHEHRSQS